MNLAIMQPYFLPYIGYWQLLHAADHFLILDDVNYINRGWINRNRILVNGSPSWITIPLQGASQNREIREIDLANDSKWRRKMLSTIRSNYVSAPFKNEMLPLLESVLDPELTNLSSFLRRSLQLVAGYVGIECKILPSSSTYPKNGLTGAHRILDLCQQLGAEHYINAAGGRELYSRSMFDDAEIGLSFIQTEFEHMNLNLPHNEGLGLSIIDLLMHNSPQEVYKSLGCYALD